MNTVNKILILVIIIFVINHLTDCQILNTLKRYFTTCQEKIEGFIGLTYTNKKCIYPNVPQIPYESQKDFMYINENDIDNLDEETYRLYRFINIVVTPNVNMYELTASKGKRIKASYDLLKEINSHLERIFNFSGFLFSNIKIINPIVYYENPRGKEIEPFNFSSDVSYQGKYIGSVVINIEAFLREDKFYYKPMKLGFLTITAVRLSSRIHSSSNKEKKWISAYKLESNDKTISPMCLQIPNSKIKKPMKHTNSQQKAINQTQKMASKMTESFNDHFVSRESYDDLFIKPSQQYVTEDFMNDTENSLIPSIVEFSSYENHL
jgi:hypothetical protein